MKNLETRYAEAIKKIGGTFGLLNLPDNVKNVLMLKNIDLGTKVKMLEAIAEAKEK